MDASDICVSLLTLQLLHKLSEILCKLHVCSEHLAVMCKSNTRSHVGWVTVRYCAVLHETLAHFC